METLTKFVIPIPKKKKIKKKNLKPASISTNKWQRIPVESWKKFNYEEILAMRPEMLKKIEEEKPRFIRVYFDHIKKVEWWGFLLKIAKKNNEKLLIIQKLGVRGNQKKTIEVVVTKKISIELST